MKPPNLRRPGRQTERGAATLVVVMVMFLILALMAAYANRNLVFEQRIASNYVRSSMATELAEAGVEWALAQLNGRNIDAACSASSDSSGSSFRGRYLSQNPSTRAVSPAVIPNTQMAASCMRSGDSAWACQCPEPGHWADAAPPASNISPSSFGVQFQPIDRPGVLRIVSAGCTGSSLTVCSQPIGAAAIDPTLSSATVRIEVALLSALQTPPAAPLVLRGTLSADELGLHNTELRSGGTLMNSGGRAPTLSADRLFSLPGAPAAQVLIGEDPTLAAVTPDAMFRLFFGLPAGKYLNQPAVLSLQCSADCSSALLNAYNGGARMIRVRGPLALSTNVTLGTLASPLLIVAEGPVTLTGPMNITGLIYARADVNWANAGGTPALLTGALISEGSVQISGHVDLWYQAAVMDALSNVTGSFVRVPASWTDG